MKLKDLKKMIKEELDAFVEAEDVDVDVDTDAGDIDAGDAEKNPEDTLRSMYDMLKDYFEGGEDERGDEQPADDVEEALEEAPKDDDDTMEEAASTGFGDAGSKKTSGKDAGYTPAKTTRGDGKLHESKALQERFQRLANIIK